MDRTWMLQHQCTDGSGNQIDVHQVTESRSRLPSMVRHISGVDGHIDEEHLQDVLSEDQFDNVLRSRSIAADVNNKAESLEVAKLISKPTQWWVQYQLDELQKKRLSYKKKIIRKSSLIEGKTVRDQIQQLDIFRVLVAS